MSKYLHTFGQYQDGHCKVDFCRLCGAEGQQLLDDCPGQQPSIIKDYEILAASYCEPITQEEFDIKYGRVDENALTKRNHRYKY